MRWKKLVTRRLSPRFSRLAVRTLIPMRKILSLTMFLGTFGLGLDSVRAAGFATDIDG